VAKQRGVLGYLDGKISRPDPKDSLAIARTPTAYWGSLSPTLDEWEQHDAWTQGLITLNVKNAIGLGVLLKGTAAETDKSIASVKDAVTDIGCITVENELNALKFSEGTDMQEHIIKMRSTWEKANAQGAGITDAKFRMILLRSMPQSSLPFVGSLHMEDTSTKVIA